MSLCEADSPTLLAGIEGIPTQILPLMKVPIGRGDIPGSGGVWFLGGTVGGVELSWVNLEVRMMVVEMWEWGGGERWRSGAGGS